MHHIIKIGKTITIIITTTQHVTFNTRLCSVCINKENDLPSLSFACLRAISNILFPLVFIFTFIIPKQHNNNNFYSHKTFLRNIAHLDISNKIRKW